MAPECDLVIVVGSRNSSNSVRLVEVALEHGARAGHLVDYADEIDEAWLDGVSTPSGVTSRRRRCPRCWCARCSTYLAERGYADVSRSSRPRRTCCSPCRNELRRDLKARDGKDATKVRHDATFAESGSLH